MGKILFGNTVSLDGFVAGPNDEVDEIFQWYYSGDTDFRFPGLDMPFKISRASARHLEERTRNIGAAVTGRRTFDIAQAWGGHPPGGGPYFVVSHTVPPEWDRPDSPFTFVRDGVVRAVELARQAAGDKDINLFSANILQQGLDAGLVDEIYIDLAPVVLGSGIRLFNHLGTSSIRMEPIATIQGTGVTHLGFRVIR